MIISCPSCGAGFNIKPEALGSSGRKVKCGKCTHLWHALPDGTAAPDAPADDAPTSPAPAPAPQPAPTPVAAPAPAAPEPEAVAEPPERDPLDSALQAQRDMPDSEPNLADQLADITAAFGESEDEDGPRLDMPTFTAPDRFDTKGEFDAEDDSPPPETGEEEDATEPGHASRGASVGRRLARRAIMSALTAAAIVIILAGGGIFLQPQITTMVPGAAAIYASMGLQRDVPGLGLTIAEPKIAGDEKILQVAGEIRNETKNPLQIPTMQARLLDGDGKPLEVWQFRAAKPKIAPGETVKYKTEFRNPPSKADRLDITFTRQESAIKGAPELARSRPPMPKNPAKPETPAKSNKPAKSKNKKSGR